MRTPKVPMRHDQRPASYLCTALALSATVWLSQATSCSSKSVPSTLDAAIFPTEVGPPDNPTFDAQGCPPSCDDDNSCTVDSCDLVTQQCVHVALPNATPCEDGSACTINDVCQDGQCFSGSFKACKALDQCHNAGVCSPKTGECTNPPAGNTVLCDDVLKCTAGDHCQNGVCKGTPVFCPRGYTCDEDFGACKNNIGLAFPAATSGLVFEGVEWASSGNPLVSTADGRLFAGGFFSGKVSLGESTLDSGDSNDHDVFLAELAPSTGTVLWSRSFPAILDQAALSVAASNGSLLALMGPLSGVLTVGSSTVTASSSTDYFVLGAGMTKGDGLWARRFNLRSKASGRGALRAMAGDPMRSAFVVCGVTDKAATDLYPSLVNQGGLDVVFGSINGQTGDTVWAQQVGGVNDEDCSAVAIDADSNIYLVGSYMYGSTVTIGGLPPLPIVDTARGTKWVFVAKLDSTGKGLWTQVLGNPGLTDSFKATAILAVSDGLVLAGTGPQAGSAGGASFAFGPIFVAKLGAKDGGIVWANPLVSAPSASATDAVTAMTSNSNGDIIMTGSYNDDLTIGSISLPLPGVTGTFVVRLDGASGQLFAARGYAGSQESDQPVGILANAALTGSAKDTSVFVGQFKKQIDFGPPLGVLSSSAAASTMPTSTMSTFVVTLVP